MSNDLHFRGEQRSFQEKGGCSRIGVDGFMPLGNRAVPWTREEMFKGRVKEWTRGRRLVVVGVRWCRRLFVAQHLKLFLSKFNVPVETGQQPFRPALDKFNGTPRSVHLSPIDSFTGRGDVSRMSQCPLHALSARRC
jgi:hypothetical protein